MTVNKSDLSVNNMNLRNKTIVCSIYQVWRSVKWFLFWERLPEIQKFNDWNQGKRGLTKNTSLSFKKDIRIFVLTRWNISKYYQVKDYSSIFAIIIFSWNLKKL